MIRPVSRTLGRTRRPFNNKTAAPARSLSRLLARALATRAYMCTCMYACMSACTYMYIRGSKSLSLRTAEAAQSELISREPLCSLSLGLTKRYYVSTAARRCISNVCVGPPRSPLILSLSRRSLFFFVLRKLYYLPFSHFH